MANETTIGTGGDHATIAAWEAATDNDLVTAAAGETGKLLDETHTLTATVVFAGATTDSTYFRTLKCNASASFRDNSSIQSTALRLDSNGGAKITGSVAAAFLYISEANFHLQDVQSENTSTGTSAYAVRTDSFSTPDIDHCLFTGSGTTAVVRLQGGLLHNSLIERRTGNGNGLFIVNSGFATTVVNCSIMVAADVAGTGAALTQATGGHTLTNVVTLGWANLFSAAPANGTYTTCRTDNTTALSGWTQSITATDEVPDPSTDATRDWRLKSGASCIDSGTTDSTNAPIDIAGTNRPSGSAYDVGCWEFVAAGGGGGFLGHGPLLAGRRNQPIYRDAA